LDVRGRLVWWYGVELPGEEDAEEARGSRGTNMEMAVGPHRRAFRPPCDVFETEKHIVIRVEIAGMREEDFRISLDGRVLRIEGSRGDAVEKLTYQRMEINYGDFALAVRLPYAVSQSEVEASYDRGFLSVSIPRQPQRRRIPISEAGSE
jgi:HSP20 family protein